MAVGLDQDTESLQRGSIPSGGAGTLSDGGFKNCFVGVWVYRPSSTATYALTAAGSIIHFQAGAREVALGFNSAGFALADLNLQIIFNSGGGAGTPATFSGHTGASFLDEWVYYFIADNPTDGQIAGYIRLADLATAVTQTRSNDNATSQYINTLTFGNTSGNNVVALGYYAYARAAYDSVDGYNTTDALAFASSSVPGSGMWGFWPLDTNTDNVDDSGNGRDLTFNGTLTTETSPTFLTITSQPADATVNAGVAPVFSITATGATSYQWQDNSSGSFANVSGGSGATTATYTAPAAAYSHQGRLFRCVLNGTTNSNSATLRVAFNLTGAGPRAYPVLGGVIGAGSVESWLRGTDAGGGGGATVNGQTLTVNASVIAGAVTAAATVDGQTATSTASVIAGAVQAAATVSGQVVNATASLIAGAVTAAADVAGQTLTVNASVLAGTASGGGATVVNGQTLTVNASVIAGAVEAAALVDSQVITVVASAIAGTVQAAATIAGQLLTSTASVIAGAVEAAAVVDGQTLTVNASVLAGTASGGGAATVNGQTLTVNASVIAGSAFVPSGDDALQSKALRTGMGMGL